MAQQGLFTLPANVNFGVSAFANSSTYQTIDVLVDNEVRTTFTGNGTDNKLLGSKVINSGKGSVQVKISANGKASDLVSNQTILTNKLNFALVGSEDGTDGDYNDGIAVLNWPLG
jgi:mannose-binding lectin